MEKDLIVFFFFTLGSRNVFAVCEGLLIISIFFLQTLIVTCNPTDD
jgi:hypothetical protein